jgi:VIT1/CCC1 family predicted Fe2+/Mn2+ transporter
MNKIIKLILAFLLAWIISYLIQRLFFNLEYEILRSSIIGVGTAAHWYLVQRKKAV